MPISWGIAFIARSNSYFFVTISLVVFSFAHDPIKFEFFLNTSIKPEQIVPLQFRVDLGVMVMKRFFTLPRLPELEPRHQMQFTVMPKTHLYFFILSPADRLVI